MLSLLNGKRILPLAVGVVCYVLALYFHQREAKPALVISKQESELNLDYNLIKFLSLGNSRLVSDVIWIQTLLEADNEHYGGAQLGNWLYLRFLTISELDPLFYENYQFGGMFLSIIKDDVEGAAVLYERGLKFYPDDYKLIYQAGFNYYYEMGEFEKGLRLLKRIVNHPQANQVIKYVVNKLQFEVNPDYASTLLFLQQQLALAQGDTLKQKIMADIYSLVAMRDLECLNAKKSDCQGRDAEGKPYVLKNGTWAAPREFKPYKIFRRDFNRPKPGKSSSS